MPQIQFQPPPLVLDREPSIVVAVNAPQGAIYAPPPVEFAPQAFVAASAPTSMPSTPALSADGETGGPNPYVDYARRYTPEDGVAFTYKTIDESVWRTVLRVAVLLFAVIVAFAYQLDASPYPILPLGCRPFGSCPVPVPGDRLLVNLLLLAGFGIACAEILFVEVQVYREIEIRPDCMILDGSEIFWAAKFELGWPQFVPGEGDTRILAGVYGTRQTEFLKVKPFDENDRTPVVFASHLMAAMRQQWDHVG